MGIRSSISRVFSRKKTTPEAKPTTQYSSPIGPSKPTTSSSTSSSGGGLSNVPQSLGGTQPISPLEPSKFTGGGGGGVVSNTTSPTGYSDTLGQPVNVSPSIKPTPIGSSGGGVSKPFVPTGYVPPTIKTTNIQPPPKTDTPIVVRSGTVQIGNQKFMGNAVVPGTGGLTANQYGKKLTDEAVARGEIKQSQRGSVTFRGTVPKETPTTTTTTSTTPAFLSTGISSNKLAEILQQKAEQTKQSVIPKAKGFAVSAFEKATSFKGFLDKKLNKDKTIQVYDPILQRGTMQIDTTTGKPILTKDVVIPATTVRSVLNVASAPAKGVQFTASFTGKQIGSLYDFTTSKLPDDFVPRWGTAVEGKTGQKITGSEVGKGASFVVTTGAYLVPGAATPLLVSTATGGTLKFFDAETEARKYLSGEYSKLPESERVGLNREQFVSYNLPQTTYEFQKQGALEVAIPTAILGTSAAIKGVSAYKQYKLNKILSIPKEKVTISTQAIYGKTLKTEVTPKGVEIKLYDQPFNIGKVRSGVTTIEKPTTDAILRNVIKARDGKYNLVEYIQPSGKITGEIKSTVFGRRYTTIFESNKGVIKYDIFKQGNFARVKLWKSFERNLDNAGDLFGLTQPRLVNKVSKQATTTTEDLFKIRYKELAKQYEQSIVKISSSKTPKTITGEFKTTVSQIESVILTPAKKIQSIKIIEPSGRTIEGIRTQIKAGKFAKTSQMDLFNLKSKALTPSGGKIIQATAQKTPRFTQNVQQQVSGKGFFTFDYRSPVTRYLEDYPLGIPMGAKRGSVLVSPQSFSPQKLQTGVYVPTVSMIELQTTGGRVTAFVPTASRTVLPSTSYLNIFGATTNEFSSPKDRVFTLTTQSISPSYKSQVNIQNLMDTSQKNMMKTNTAFKTMLSPMVSSSIKTQQKTQQKVQQAQVQRLNLTPQLKQLTPRTPTIRTPTLRQQPRSPRIEKPKLMLGIKTKSLKLPSIKQRGFKVFGRRFGVFKQIGTGRTSSEAVQIGKRFAENTLGVTFKVPKLKEQKLKGFKTKKTKEGILYVEKIGRRLKKKGLSKEVGEIQLYRKVKGGRKLR